jgi:hypothetical protein
MNVLGRFLRRADVGAYELEGADREAFEALERAHRSPTDTVGDTEAAAAAAAVGNGERDAAGHASRRSRGQGQSKVMHAAMLVREESELELGAGRTSVDMVAAADRLLGNVSEHARVSDDDDCEEAAPRRLLDSDDCEKAAPRRLLDSDDCEEAASRRLLDDPGGAEGVGAEDAHSGQPPTGMSSEYVHAHWEQWRTWASYWWWVWWAQQHFPAEGGYLPPTVPDAT